MCGTNNVLYSIILILIGRTSLFSVPIILEHLFDIFSECFFQFSWVSNVNPKKLKSLTLIIIILFILGTGYYCYEFFFCMWKTMDLVTLRESLFISSHSLIL